MIGRSIAQFAIKEKLGEGGMGVVYKAEDKQLGRFVALKALPAAHLADEGRRARFLREARSVSALNHPNIVTIYDLVNEGGGQYLVMEFVDGKTLEQLIHGRGLPLAEALRLAIPIADALSEAHKAGITHRDLKPGNVMVTAGGLVKLLDFGLAKLTESPAARSGDEQLTQTAADTEIGTVVGTISYMSPEQAQGLPVDTRSDIFSFGALLYEMITGRRAFQGDNKMATLLAVVEKEPKPASEIIPSLPRDVDRIIHRCLRKDPAKRAQTMADLKVALEELKEESESGRLPGSAVAAPVAKSSRRYLWAGIAAAVALAALAAWKVPSTWNAPAGGPRKVALTTYPGSEIRPSISPDGKQVAFSWNGEKQDNFDIYVKMIDSGEPLRLTRDPKIDSTPVWSPDGSQIAFVRSGGRSGQVPAIYAVSALGGAERKLADAASDGLTWSPDGKTIVYGGRDGLFALDLSSGSSKRLTPVANDGSFYSAPSFSPDGGSIAVSHSRSVNGARDLLILPAEGGEPKRLNVPPGFVGDPVWVAGGREIVYYNQWNPLSRIAVKGGPPSIIEISDNAAIRPAYHEATARLIYSRQDADINIWGADLAGTKAPQAIISSTKRDFGVQASPDGARLAFTSDRSGYWEIWRSDADGSNQVPLTAFKGAIVDCAYWSPDGKDIAFGALVKGNRDIFIVGSEGGPVRQLTTEPSEEGRPSFSRDGKWLYFRSDRSGRPEIWKMAPTGGAAQQVTRSGGFDIRESMDGASLYFTQARLKSGVWTMPAAGGEPRPVSGLEQVMGGQWAMTSAGIFWISPRDNNALMQWDSRTQKNLTVLTIGAHIFNATAVLWVTPDGKKAYWHQDDDRGADLVLIENFR